MRLAARVRKAWQHIRTVPGLGRNVAALAALLVLALISGGIILGSQGSGLSSWPWTDRFRFQATFAEAHGVAAGQGQEVRIAGVTVGAIESASVSDDGKAVLRLGIDPEQNIYDNARLVLRPKSPLNEMYVTIAPGGPPGKPIADGHTFPIGNSEAPVTIDRFTQHLDDDARLGLSAMLSEADAGLAHAARDLPRGLTATDQVVRSLQPVMAELRKRRGAIAGLVSALADVSGTVGGDRKRLTALAADLQQTLDTLADENHPLDSAVRQLPRFLEQLKRATGAVQTLSGQLDPTLDNLRKASDSLPRALRELRSTADEASGFVDKAGPVVEALRPVVADLRPVVGHVNAALPDLRAVTGQLDPVTGALVPYLDDLAAFTYNTASITSLRDDNGVILRTHLVIPPETIPLLNQLKSRTR